MYMILVAVVVVGATAYVWCTRGFFSAFIHMICVIAAGAIAFGVWEPLAELIRDNAPDRGSFTWISGTSLALGLAIPFAISLAILRGFIDKVLPANAQCEKVADYVGGGVCGLVSGVISAGIVVLASGFLRVDPDFLGYASASYSSSGGRGSIQKNTETFVPWVDRIVAGMYSHLSKSTLRTSEPLAKWHPELATYPGELRVTYDNKSRNDFRRSDFAVTGWYQIGDTQRGLPPNTLLKDAWSGNAQKVTDLNNEPPTGNGYLVGFAVEFKPSARERTGNVFVGNSQVRLVVESLSDDDTKPLHPVAVICRTDSTSNVAYARFRYDSDNLFISNAGAEAEPKMAFEFLVPANYRPIGLYVKGVRYTIDEEAKPTKTYASPMERDVAIESGQFMGMTGVGPILGPDGKPIQAPQVNQVQVDPFQVNAGIGFTIQKGTEGGSLTIAQDSRGWAIQEGQTVISKETLQKVSSEKNLRVDRFQIDNDKAMVKLVITPSQRSPEFVDALENSDPTAQPILVDTKGTYYPAVGFVYKDSRVMQLRFNQSQPLKTMKDAPTVSRNTPDRELTLIFVVDNLVDIREFRIGSIVDDWSNKPKHVDMPARR